MWWFLAIREKLAAPAGSLNDWAQWYEFSEDLQRTGSYWEVSQLLSMSLCAAADVPGTPSKGVM